MAKDNPFDLTEDEDTPDTAPVDEKTDEKTEEAKTEDKPKRRTKAEIEADEKNREIADQLLVSANVIKETGGSVEIFGVVMQPAGEANHRLVGEIQVRTLPVNSASGHIVGEIRLHQGRPVVNISKKFWVGEPPLSLSVAQLDELLTVLLELREKVQA